MKNGLIITSKLRWLFSNFILTKIKFPNFETTWWPTHRVGGIKNPNFRSPTDKNCANSDEIEIFETSFFFAIFAWAARKFSYFLCWILMLENFPKLKNKFVLRRKFENYQITLALSRLDLFCYRTGFWSKWTRKWPKLALFMTQII